MYDGPIIDTHHHIWEVANYPWLMAPMSPKIFGDSYEPLRHDYLITKSEASVMSGSFSRMSLIP